MFGLIVKITAVPGKRDELVAMLLETLSPMPGCLSYIVATDASDEHAIWFTEAWDSQATHDASLLLPSVKETFAKARPLIAGIGDRVMTTPLGGIGLVLPTDR
jgi:quinol monooxygenase YgiN